MVSVSLREQLNRLVVSLYNEGVLDRQFDLLRRMQAHDYPGYIADVLTMFCRESDIVLGFIDQLLEKPVVDYRRISGHVHHLKGSSSSVGGRCVTIYCDEFRRCYTNNDTAGIMRALNRIKQESFRLRIDFQTVIELEKRILAENTASSSRSVNES